MSTALPTRGLHAESTIDALPLDAILTFAEITSLRLVKIDVELSPRWWPDPHLRPVDVLRPFSKAGFNVYRMKNSYSAWRYLWPNQVSDAIRLREPLTRRVQRLDLVLSRHNGDRLAIDGRS
ncbi:hypothetical protein ORI20_22480 [Mycobacterium sp. CVI_P3]|uniref:Rhodanese domain-containing protein n=1 Tax=Mycobacterium pinniadriaticum TaxID=2994102 RepID=A0ABT3SIW1_9MYCO|nr:hypothetical protein [Mycobacterium pinniadriaticum]MCX2933042.1 hypothetical protein [Mycobacterium pinniadriaticum]MCX2939464.1 hypothetical protein [Mycobacterium pinniadriaticum]